MEETIKVRPITDYTTSGLRAGDAVALWGHTFVMQKDGMLVCEMPINVARHELGAGRVMRYQASDFVNRAPVDPVGSALDKFTMDIGTYYGAGDLDVLQKRIEKLKVTEIQEFTEKRFNFTWPSGMTKEVMVGKLIDAVEDTKNTGREE